MSKLIVVIVNWNTLELTRDCLNTLVPELEELDNEIWMVDNASADDSVQMIKTEFPQIKLIQNEENVGFAKANNQILEQAEGDYYLLLNTDTIVPDGSIIKLCRFMDENPNAAAVGPRLRNGHGVVEQPLKPLPTLSGEFRFCLVMHFPPFGRFFRFLFRNRLPDWRQIDKPTEAEVLSAAALLIRAEATKKVGLLAEDYFLFSEENDFFFRMRKAGFTSYYRPDVEIIHLIGMSRKKRGRIDSELNFFKSRMLFFSKHFGEKLGTFKTIYRFFFVWSRIIMVVSSVLKGRKSEESLLYQQLLQVLREGV